MVVGNDQRPSFESAERPKAKDTHRRGRDNILVANEQTPPSSISQFPLVANGPDRNLRSAMPADGSSRSRQRQRGQGTTYKWACCFTIESSDARPCAPQGENLPVNKGNGARRRNQTRQETVSTRIIGPRDKGWAAALALRG